jgi:hypothetical protein
VTKRCKESGCITRLSSYNPADRCWVHAEPTWYSQGGTSRLGRWEAKRRQEELEGKHPEDLRHIDGGKERQLAALRGDLPIWDELHRRYSQRKPRDVMEA